MTFQYSIAPGGQNTRYGPDTGPPPPRFFMTQTGSTLAGLMQGPAYAQPFFSPQPVLANPSPAKPAEGELPGLSVINHINGRGIPIGYQYFFPQQHTYIHAIKSDTKPWQVQNMNQQMKMDHHKLFVPSLMTTKELMQNLGLDNPDAKMNVIWECVEAGNGQWKSGMRFLGDDKDRIKEPISKWGWNKTRTGGYGRQPVVWLWCSSTGS